jgi:hypothetical protein
MIRKFNSYLGFNFGNYLRQFNDINEDHFSHMAKSIRNNQIKIYPQ